MPVRRVQLGPLETVVSMDPDQMTLSFGAAFRNSLWKALYRKIFDQGASASPEPRKSLGSAGAGEWSPEQRELARRIDEIEWYHTIDLGSGLVTPGYFDHRPYLDRYHLPERMDGLRVLDVATFDGFWAFEFERRGAEVVALDIEKFGDVDLSPRARAAAPLHELERPIGQGFELARTVLGSRVRKEILSVYNLSPERLGTFDLVFCGDLLIHLMNPVKALQAIASVVSGQAMFSEPYHPALDRFGPLETVHYSGGTGFSIWWMYGSRALERMVYDAGFREVEVLSRFQLGVKKAGIKQWHAILRATPESLVTTKASKTPRDGGSA